MVVSFGLGVTAQWLERHTRVVQLEELPVDAVGGANRGVVAAEGAALAEQEEPNRVGDLPTQRVAFDPVQVVAGLRCGQGHGRLLSGRGLGARVAGSAL